MMEALLVKQERKSHAATTLASTGSRRRKPLLPTEKSGFVMELVRPGSAHFYLGTKHADRIGCASVGALAVGRGS